MSDDGIRRIHNPWRDKYKQGSFRGVGFLIENNARTSGRRTVPHQYPKRNEPYAEDMGREARTFRLTGFLIGPQYLDERDALIQELEKDGPGVLRVPLPFVEDKGGEINVMNTRYVVSEAREKGGYCQIDMDFIEYGKPGFGTVMTETKVEVVTSATALESMASEQAFSP